MVVVVTEIQQEDEQSAIQIHFEASVMYSLGSSPERQDLVKRPREVVATVSIDSLEQTQCDPNVLQKCDKAESAQCTPL
jgi:hypothetical protein